MKYCIYVKFSRTERGKVIHMNLSNMSMKEFLTMFSELGKQKSIKIWGGGYLRKYNWRSAQRKWYKLEWIY